MSYHSEGHTTLGISAGPAQSWRLAKLENRCRARTAALPWHLSIAHNVSVSRYWCARGFLEIVAIKKALLALRAFPEPRMG